MNVYTNGRGGFSAAMLNICVAVGRTGEGCGWWCLREEDEKEVKKLSSLHAGGSSEKED